jgi:hypothetical protein
MVVWLAATWRVAFAVAFLVAILLSACARAPRRAIPIWELRRLMACALLLYAVGGLAKLTDHGLLAGLVFSAGIMISALAAWLSRGRDQEDPPDDGDPVDEHPPPGPDGVPWFDWAAFERDFRSYARNRSKVPAA